MAFGRSELLQLNPTVVAAASAARTQTSPWRRARTIPLAFAALAALFHLVTHPGMYQSDTTIFLRESWLAGDRSPFPVIPPVYPLILDLLFVAVPASARMFALVFFQQLAIVAAAWCVLRIFELQRQPGFGIVAASLVALYVPLYEYAQTAYTEAFFIAFALAAAHQATRAWSAERPAGPAMLCGMLIAVSAGQRAVGIAIVCSVVAAIVLSTLRRKTSLLAWTGAGYAVTTAILIANNYLHHGYASISNGTGLHMFGRIAVVDRWLPDTPEARHVQSEAARFGMPDVLLRQAGWRLQNILVYQSGLTHPEADRLLRTVALQAMIRRPVAALRGTITSMNAMVEPLASRWYILQGGIRPEGYKAQETAADDVWKEDLPTLNRMRNELPPYPPRRVLGAWTFSVAEAWSDACLIVRRSWVLLALAAVLLAALWRRDEVLLLTSGTASALLVLAALGDAPEPRYWDPAVPFFMMSLVWMAGALVPSRSSSDAARSIPRPVEHRQSL